MAGCYFGPAATPIESWVKVTNNSDAPVIITVENAEDIDPATGVTATRTRSWLISPTGYGPLEYARTGGHIDIYASTCELIQPVVMTHGNEWYTVGPDGSVTRDPWWTGIGDPGPISGITSSDGCPPASPSN